jgi:DNA-binding PadR family transcriptional regulator
MMLREKPMSGSEIADQIERETEGEYRPGSGSLYPVLKKLHTSGITEKLPIDEGVYRYRLTDKGNSFFEEHYDVMQEVRKKLDAVEFPFTNLFQNNPQFRTYFMRISKAMMTISDLSDGDIDPEIVKRVEKVVSRSANELEEILKSIKSK